MIKKCIDSRHKFHIENVITTFTTIPGVAFPLDKWMFIEVSWHKDSGLQVFIDQKLVIIATFYAFPTSI